MLYFFNQTFKQRNINLDIQKTRSIKTSQKLGTNLYLETLMNTYLDNQNRIPLLFFLFDLFR